MQRIGLKRVLGAVLALVAATTVNAQSARPAVKTPRIYVFDEATSSLDSRTEGDIMHNLREISRDSTTLVIAHRLSTVVHADEIIVLEGGVIAERGTHFGLLRQNGRYARLWEAQQQSTERVKALA